MGKECFTKCLSFKRKMTVYRLLFVVLHIFQASESSIQFISPYAGRTVTGLVGSSVNFTWSFSGDNGHAVATATWGLPTKDLVSISTKFVTIDISSGSVVIYSGRVSGQRSSASPTGQVIFTLNNISKDDPKLYACEIATSLPVTPAQLDTVRFDVKGPPDISDISINQTVIEGQKMTLNCTADGNPTPTITWTRLVDNNVVTFPLTITRQDEGAYRCTADNGIGIVSTDRFITVQYKPEGIKIIIPENPTLQGQDVTITCHVTEAKPPVSEFKFFFNDTAKPVQNVNHFTMTNVQRSQHYGKYKCAARNDVGEGQSDEVFLNINVLAKIISLTPNVTVNKGNPFHLRCDASGHPTPVIKWKKDGGPEQSTGSNHYRFDSSKTSDSGTYVCIAENVVGRTEMKTFVTVYYAATVKSATSSTTQSWIGQTVSFTCVAEGVPTPTITWKKPSGLEIKNVTTVYTANIVMKNDQDFGEYTCEATNGVGAAASKAVKVQQIKAPGLPSITVNIQATSITVSWTAPADDGGSPITAYRVVVLRGRTEIRNENVTNRLTKEKFIDRLNKSTNYTVKVFARNSVFEGNAAEREIQTKFVGIPAAAEITDLPAETKEVKISLKWKAAQDNGASITKYTVYRRTINEDGTAQEWIKFKVKDPSDRKVVLTLQKGKAYELVVTATNSFGEGGKEEGKIKKITVLGDVPSAVVFTYEIKDDEIILNWEEPNNNGAAITLYTVYQRIVNDEQWTKSGAITDISKREYVVKVEKGKEYEFVVTATNKYGEYPKKDNMKKVKVPGASTRPTENQTGSSCDDKMITLHAIYVTVVILLLISNTVLIFFLCKMCSRSEHPVRSNRNCPRCGDLIAMNPITVKVEANTKPSSSVPRVDAPTYAAPVGTDYMSLNPSTKNWEISREQVNIIKVIGKGAFSKVAQATVTNIRGSQESTTVAVKMLKANAPASDRKDLLSELELMKKLKPNPHVIKLIGCVTESDPLLVLIEYVPFGDLLGYLRKSRGLNDTYFKDPDVKPQSSLTAEQLMKFAWQVADGMFYLSSKKIIHRDLAARNVLVGEGEKCKVTDFGMARNVQQDDIYNRTSRGRLPVKWTAYEALMYGTYTTQSDVWSFGVLLYEILTVGGSPYPEINPREIARKLQEGYRMPKPRHVEDKLYQIMLRCWEENPLDRPTFDKLRKTMKEMERNHKTYVNLNQYDHSLYANVQDLAAE